MPKFRMNRKTRDERQQFESPDVSKSFPRPPPTPPRSVDLQISARFKSPQDSTQELTERINAWTLNASEEAAAEIHSQISRRPYMRTEHMIRSPPPPVPSDVLVVGAGPAGLMLAGNLLRFGISTDIIDNRSERTATGRADGLQPRSIETLKQLRLADRILLKGVKVNEIRLWKSTQSEPMKRVAKQSYFPGKSLDCLDPYLLLVHQGFVEDLLLKDIMERGVDVQRNVTFVDYVKDGKPEKNIEVICKPTHSEEKLSFAASYVIGCDGAQSNVRKSMGSRMVGSSYDQVWGVIDGELDTDFPDVYSKTIIHNDEAGSCIILPRERGMTRVYVELKPEIRDIASKGELSQEFVLEIIREILEPYRVHWRHIEWFGRYQIGQKHASNYEDDGRVFICGDATKHVSPNASQGMNTSIHDACNLAWKLNLAIRGLAKPILLKTYEEERRQVAEDLLGFDYQHTNAFSSVDLEALSDDFERGARFTSGYGADYSSNVLNVPQKGSMLGMLRAGSVPPPAKVTRHFDSNPVDIQLDIPYLGQFRIYFFAKSIEPTKDFLEVVSQHALSYTSGLGKMTCAANASYTLQPPLAAVSDEFTRPERYTTVSGLFTFALVLQQKARDFELDELPQLFKDSRYTVYADDVPHLDTRSMTCTHKWLGAISGSEVGVVVLRPDGYVGTVGRFIGRSKENGVRANKWLDDYFDGFLLSGF